MKIRRFLITAALFAVALSSVVATDRYALVDISTAYVRSRPSHSGELVTQQLMGFPVKILAVEGEWYRVETIDGYKGYIIGNTLHPVSTEEYNEWKNSERVIVNTNKEQAIAAADGKQISDIVPGAILEYEGVCPGDSLTAHVILPDGREGTDVSDGMEPTAFVSRQSYRLRHG